MSPPDASLSRRASQPQASSSSCVSSHSCCCCATEQAQVPEDKPPRRQAVRSTAVVDRPRVLLPSRPSAAHGRKASCAPSQDRSALFRAHPLDRPARRTPRSPSRAAQRRKAHPHCASAATSPPVMRAKRLTTSRVQEASPRHRAGSRRCCRPSRPSARGKPSTSQPAEYRQPAAG